MGLVSYLSGKFSKSEPFTMDGSIYDFKITSLEGKTIDFAQFKGKKLLIVNTASKCGLTPQYAHLQRLHEERGDNITILGFPANDFLWQEPGSNEEIATFCERNYGVTFLMFEKISVKGSDKHPLYKWLEGKTGSSPDWNFAKYLVDEDGNTVKFYKSKVRVFDKPLSDDLAK